MKKIIAAVALSCCFNVLASEVPSSAVQPIMAPMAVDPIKERFAELGLTVSRVQDSPVAGLKTVLTDKGVFYASPEGKYLIQGTMVDLENRVNVTDQALNPVRKEGVSEYTDSMIVYKAENEKHQITVFTDITCGYCRKLHRELEDYLAAGITVKYLAYPRGGIGSGGYNDLMNVWCAKDAAQAMTDAKAGQKVAKVDNCNAPVSEHYQLGQSFGLSGTPAIILEDGTLIPGYQGADELAATLERMNKKS